ncbi:MAG TPA: magnesium chelatase ATPase subunit I [Pyrinomonadaceae bacterium]|nr:magnesium chelatase ATPase subunit I [Pyrinomonadaceae bacterium]
MTKRARPVFPFAAIVGQEEMRLALLLNVVAPSVGGVLVMGHRGTGKSTAVRALADLLPPLRVVRGCPLNCDPQEPRDLCDACRARAAAGRRLASERRPVGVVDLPLGATEDRVCGTIDIERAVREGVKAFEPGLLARADRGFLYIDEVNLLEDHLVDLLLDVAATGTNRVEREGVSAEHPARFVLVGSGNPEEGELRPQLLDRFGLCVEVETERDLDRRVRIVELREAFERDPAGFAESVRGEQESLRRRLLRAKRAYERVEMPRPLLRSVAELCLRLKIDGHRGELTIARAARALAAFEGRKKVTAGDVRRVAAMSLRHRLRRDPFEQSSGGPRIAEEVEELFGDGRPGGGAGDSGGDLPPDSFGGNGRRATPHETPAAAAGPRGETAGREAAEQMLPPAGARLPSEAFADAGRLARRHPQVSFTSRRRKGARRSAAAGRGRYAGAAPKSDGARALALDATLRASATRRTQTAGEGNGAPHVAGEDLRFKRFRAKTGTLFIFAVDTSGSMAVNRIGQAKGALAHLLRRSYVNRDRVALVSFRGRGAETLLRPCGSPALARRVLDSLPVGGATPLAAGLLRVLELARRAAAGGDASVRLVLFTDGRANVPLGETPPADRSRLENEVAGLGASLRAAGVASTVVDTQNRFASHGGARALAEKLGGAYVQLPPNGAGRAFEKL